VKLTKAEREVLNEELDEILSCADDTAEAARFLYTTLHGWAGGGVPFAVEMLCEAQLNGLKQVIRNRTKSRRVAVGTVSLPATYAVNGAAASWMHVSVGELDHVIHRLTSQAHTLNEHAGVLSEAKELASKFSVETPAEAYTAAGIVVAVSA